MTRKNSRAKGARGEREFAAFLRGHGFDARRGQQFAGGADSPDIVSESLSWLHIEVKRVEHFNVAKACAQAARDSAGKPWIVAHRRNRKPWFITMDADTGYRFLAWGDSPCLALSQATNPWPLTVEANIFFELLRGFQPRSASRMGNNTDAHGLAGGKTPNTKIQTPTLGRTEGSEGEEEMSGLDGVSPHQERVPNGGPEDYLGCGDGRAPHPSPLSSAEREKIFGTRGSVSIPNTTTKN